MDNLISNAIKYGARSPIEVVASADDDEVRIEVRDRGPGIPPSDRDRIFGRFERAVGTGERRSGFGVGLWIVGQLVEAMAGTIAVDDVAGGGTSFRLVLPRYGDRSAS